MDHGWKCIGRCHYDHISSKSPAAFYNIQVNGILHEKPRLSLLHDPKIMDKPEVCSRTRKYTCNFCCIDYRQKLSQVITLFLSNLLRSSQCWFLVGAFLGKSARYLQWLVFFLFFSSDYNLTLIGPLFLQSKLLKLLPLGQVWSAEISAKGSPFHFLLF